MQDKYTSKHPNDFDVEINLLEIFYILFRGKWIIVSVTAFASIFAVIYSLSLPNIYESKALLAPVNPSNNIAGAYGNYGNLAGAAGINLFSSVDEGNAPKAIKQIKSLNFFKKNIMTNIYLPDLMAFKSWNPKTNTVIFDDNIYDTNTNTWIRDYSYPRQQIPSAQEGFKVFITKHLSLSEDKKTGFITLSIKHQSPFIAKEWVELIVNEVNSFYRQKDKSESEKSVSYLNQQISMTDLSEINQVLAQLLQEETKKLTLIEANQFYVFDYIDPPAVMELKSEPNRALICIFIALIGGMLSVVLVLIRHYAFSEKT
ncbi:MAG: chain length determinant protein [Gammaproteobacteria bacterium]|nr:chain length determinant protein [Gammaproteobacteria bacterium]|tara:strand:+ start:25 stop:969 length:945 start_codon:yes stop_codon:yes gene_type:complete